MKAEELLKQKGHYYPMPKPFTKGDVIKSMEEYSSLQIKEVIEEIEKSDDSVFTNGEPTHFGKGVKTGKKIAIEILKSKIK
jgi:hypothetical protein